METVHSRSKYGLDISGFATSEELFSYWFGYIEARGYIFNNRGRLRIRAPMADMNHLYQLCKDLGTIKAPRKVEAMAFNNSTAYSQLIIDSNPLCNLLRSQHLDDVNERHALRGLLDGRGTIGRNGKGKQSKYLKITYRLKGSAQDWVEGKLGAKTFVGSKAVEVARHLYLNQSRYLKRKFDMVSEFIF
jgi:hypothetical protein